MRDSVTIDEVSHDVAQMLRDEIASEDDARIARELQPTQRAISDQMADDPVAFFRELVGADTSYGEALLIAIQDINKPDAGWPELLAYKFAFDRYVKAAALAELGVKPDELKERIAA